MSRFGPVVGYIDRADVVVERPINKRNITCLIRDALNIEMVHEHIFYDDGSDLGFFGTEAFGGPGDLHRDNPALRSQYRMSTEHYDDNRLRRAVANVGKPDYNLVGSNCQDWAQGVREEYRRLESVGK